MDDNVRRQDTKGQADLQLCISFTQQQVAKLPLEHYALREPVRLRDARPPNTSNFQSTFTRSFDSQGTKRSPGNGILLRAGPGRAACETRFPSGRGAEFVVPQSAKVRIERRVSPPSDRSSHDESIRFNINIDEAVLRSSHGENVSRKREREMTGLADMGRSERKKVRNMVHKNRSLRGPTKIRISDDTPPLLKKGLAHPKAVGPTAIFRSSSTYLSFSALCDDLILSDE
uniref:Uncharacterized protein n=1 Tax=Steinernema glaseri TaxID=37863 RepID=A0A1I8AMR5_9BILA